MCAVRASQTKTRSRSEVAVRARVPPAHGDNSHIAVTASMAPLHIGDGEVTDHANDSLGSIRKRNAHHRPVGDRAQTLHLGGESAFACAFW